MVLLFATALLFALLCFVAGKLLAITCFLNSEEAGDTYCFLPFYWALRWRQPSAIYAACLRR